MTDSVSSFEVQEGFSLKDGVLSLALTNSIGENGEENVILYFNINDEKYSPGYYQGFFNKSLVDFSIIQNNTLCDVPRIPNMYHPNPVFHGCSIEWNPALINALSVYLFKGNDGTDVIVRDEILSLLNKITGCVVSN